MTLNIALSTAGTEFKINYVTNTHRHLRMFTVVILVGLHDACHHVNTPIAQEMSMLHIFLMMIF